MFMGAEALGSKMPILAHWPCSDLPTTKKLKLRNASRGVISSVPVSRRGDPPGSGKRDCPVLCCCGKGEYSSPATEEEPSQNKAHTHFLCQQSNNGVRGIRNGWGGSPLSRCNGAPHCTLTMFGRCGNPSHGEGCTNARSGTHWEAQERVKVC